jgi:hypothetical protein
MDDYTNFPWSLFLKTKDQLTTIVLNLIIKLQREQDIRGDKNSKENVALKNKWTTIQASVFNMIILLLIHHIKMVRFNKSLQHIMIKDAAKFTWDWRSKLWAYCTNLSTDLAIVLNCSEEDSVSTLFHYGLNIYFLLENLLLSLSPN